MGWLARRRQRESERVQRIMHDADTAYATFGRRVRVEHGVLAALRTMQGWFGNNELFVRWAVRHGFSRAQIEDAMHDVIEMRYAQLSRRSRARS